MTTLTPQQTVVELSPSIEALFSAEDCQRLRALNVDLGQYERIFSRQVFEPIKTRPINRDIAAALTKAYAAKLSPKAPNPVMLTHIVTTRCNYSCHFCCFADSLNNKTNELTLTEIEKTYATIGNSMNVIVYSGGETTLNKDLPDIIEAAYRLTPVKSVYIISNAWKPDVLFDITHRIKQSCPELHLTWSLSIEGLPETNNKSRYTQNPKHNAWQNTVDTLWGMKALREHFNYSQLDVQLCTVCSPSNYTELPEWYTMIRDTLKPDKWNLNLMRRSVQMTDNELASFEARRASGILEPFEQAYLDITEQLRQDVISGTFNFKYHTDNVHDGAMKSAVDLLSQEENRATVRGDVLSFKCQAGKYGAYISSDGMVSACEEFAHNPNDEKSFGNLQDVNCDFQALWHNEKANAYRKLAGRAKECFGCTLESQRNYPSILLSPVQLWKASQLAKNIH